MSKFWRLVITIIAVIGIAITGIYMNLPVQRVDVTSDLVMLGDLNRDRSWDELDGTRLTEVLATPFEHEALLLQMVDVNRNDAIDAEDVAILDRLFRVGDPYMAQGEAHEEGVAFPRPRELFKYWPRTEYVSRPVFVLPHEAVARSPLGFLHSYTMNDTETGYELRLRQEIYDEALRLSVAWERREPDLNEIEREYAELKLAQCDLLYEEGRLFSLLLHLVGLVEDAETLTMRGQSEFITKILYFRDHLQDLLVSEEVRAFENGESDHREIFEAIELNLHDDLGIDLKLDELEPPRDYLDLQNYVDRAVWQRYKSLTTEDQFKNLILYAQYDRRYLRSVSRTSPKMTDTQLRNHNLPMILLFHEALRIRGGDKLAAVGMLDEAIRIPLGWVKSIPPEMLPSSLALDNFLLPGNMEDGSDKSRHWNVFGGIALHRSPEESLILSLRREIADVRDDAYSVDSVREFIRDTIANVNGIYSVVTMDPELS
ncbi:MAG: hypothetical protein GY906_30235 [bacterium]|nr:hypothetical protein [bacterium]